MLQIAIFETHLVKSLLAIQVKHSINNNACSKKIY